jgi:hypothetical protein
VGSGQSFADSSLSNHTVTAVGDVTHSTAQSKFSGGSIYFDGTGDYLSVPDSSDWSFGTGDFTIDFWFYSTNNGGNYRGLVCQIPTTLGSLDSGAGLFIEMNTTTLRLFVRNGSGDLFTEINGSGLSEDTWYHAAVVRAGNTVYFYKNGTSLGSSSYSGTWPDWATPLLVGLRMDQATYFAGYMDEVRVTKGVALWTQDFNPPARRDTLSISDGMMYNGTCIDLDGTDDYIDLGPIAFGTKNISVAMWFTIDSYDQDYGDLFLNRGSSGGGQIGFEIRQRTAGDGKIEVQFDWGVASNNIEVEGVSTGAWHHIVATMDRSGYLRGYLDGVEFETPLDISAHSAVDITSDENALIGKDVASAEWNGKVGDLKIYENTVLSASQVTELYNDSKVIIPSNVSQTNLMGWWPLAEGAGTLCYDGSGNGRTGTITNGEDDEWLTGQTGAPQLVEGYNRPMLFDTTDNYVNCGGASGVLNITGSITLGAWVYVPNLSASSVVVTKGNVDGGASTIQYNLYVDANNAVKLQLSNGSSGATVYTGTSAVAVDTWTHVAGTFDASSGTAKIYVNGVSQSITGGSTGLSALGSTAIVCYIGADKYTDRYYFNGLVNEVVVYSSELTAAQVLALAATDPNGGPLPPDPMSLSNSSDLAGYWRNDGNVTWTDRSGNGNDGTVYGSPDTLLFKQGINGSASTSTGRDGQGFPLLYENNGAIGFSGALADEGIRVTGIDPTSLSYITVSAWVKIVGNTNWGTIAMQADTNSFDEGWGLGFSGTSTNFMWWVDIYTDPAQADISSHYGKWLHVVGTYDGTDQKLYFNGVEVDSEADTWTNKGSATNEIHVGTGIGTANTIFRYGLDGQIGNIQIYNRTLSYAEIQQNYNAQKSRFT